MAETFPSGDLDTGRRALSQLGSYWSTLFPDRSTLLAFLEGLARGFDQTERNLQEAESAVSRQDIEPLHRELWVPLRLTSGSLADIDFDKLRYGTSGVLYGSGRTYGERTTTTKIAYPLHSGVRHIVCIANRIADPSVMLIHGHDFVLDTAEHLLIFNDDPFASALIPQRELFDADGASLGSEILLWAFAVDYDQEAVYQHFGYVLGIGGTSETAYRDIINALWDARLAGLSSMNLRRLLSAVTGVAVPRDAGTIQRIAGDANEQLVVTEGEVNRFSATSDLSALFVGKPVEAGDLLSKAIQINELNGSNVSLPADIDALVLGPGYLEGGYEGSLSFENVDVDLEYLGADDDDIVEVRFRVLGLAEDVKFFWERVHARGKAAGFTLANALDQRATPLGEPVAASLPTQVNPAKLLVEHVMGNHLFLIRLKLSEFVRSPDNLRYVSDLRSVLPAHTAFMLFVDVDDAVEYVVLDATPITGGGEGQDQGVIRTITQAVTDTNLTATELGVTAHLIAENAL